MLRAANKGYSTFESGCKILGCISKRKKQFISNICFPFYTLMAFQRDLKCEGVTEKNDTIVQLSNECVDLLSSLVHFCTCFVLEEKKGGY